MMRKPLVAGNWKMNKNLGEARDLVKELKDNMGSSESGVEVMIAPPAIFLSSLASETGDILQVGTQDVSEHQSFGAFTGEVTATMIKSAGGSFAIIAHSERRTYHHETDDMARRKIAACIAAGIVPIYCCGESLEHRESNRQEEVVERQILQALQGFKPEELASLVIAYEPVWAIGTGKTATAEQAQEIHAYIRKILREKYGETVAANTRILYGGSANPSNADSLFSQPDVDGGLIGGASLKPNDFIAIVRAAAK